MTKHLKLLIMVTLFVFLTYVELLTTILATPYFLLDETTKQHWSRTLTGIGQMWRDIKETYHS